MKCPVCSHVYPDTLSRCSRCGRVSLEGETHHGDAQSTLIEFPRSNRPSLPDWRVELNEKVRAIKARRSMEAMVGEASSARQAALAPVPPVDVVPEEEEEQANPIVTAALDRVRRASEQAARYNTRGDSTGRTRSAAYARAPMASTAASPAFLEEREPTARLSPLQAVVPVEAVAVAPSRDIAPTVRSEPALFDPSELLDELDSDEAIFAAVATDAEPEPVRRTAGLLPQALRQAPVLSRFAGGLIDFAVLGVVALPFLAVVKSVNGDIRNPAIAVLLGSTILFVAAFYFFSMLSVSGKTIGMKFGHIRVVDSNGQHPTPSSLLLRVLGYVLASLPAGLGFALALFDAEGRGLHDRISGTRVIED